MVLRCAALAAVLTVLAFFAIVLGGLYALAREERYIDGPYQGQWPRETAAGEDSDE